MCGKIGINKEQHSTIILNFYDSVDPSNNLRSVYDIFWDMDEVLFLRQVQELWKNLISWKISKMTD